MRLYSIASASSGNAIYIGSENTHILIDAGLSMKRIEAGLGEIDLSLKDIDGICVTHEHHDHIQGIGPISRKYHIPVYATKGTINIIKKKCSLENHPDELFHVIRPTEDFEINDIRLHAMRVHHDAKEPVAYKAMHEKKSIAVATDTGCFDDDMIEVLTGLDAILLEANHDVKMLEAGPYPYELKRRILSDIGHLSNEVAGKLLCHILHDDLKHVLLGHLSPENNYPDLAYESVRCEVNEGSMYKADDFDIRVAHRDRPSEVIEI